jgi:hypothetical protein
MSVPLFDLLSFYSPQQSALRKQSSKVPNVYTLLLTLIGSLRTPVQILSLNPCSCLSHIRHSATLNMEITDSSETAGNDLPHQRRHVPEDSIFFANTVMRTQH